MNTCKGAPTLRALKDRWPSTIVSRSKVPEFTGGIVSSRYLANLDSAGLGVEGAFKIGRQVCYPVDALIDWLISRVEVN